MTHLEISSNDIADIFAGEMAMANANYFASPLRTYVDEDGKTYHHINYENTNTWRSGNAKRDVLRNCILSIADRFAQASDSQHQQFNRNMFYRKAGLQPNGELVE